MYTQEQCHDSLPWGPIFGEKNNAITRRDSGAKTYVLNFQEFSL